MKYINQVIPSLSAWSGAWCVTLIHAWNPDLVKEHYPTQQERALVRHDDGTQRYKESALAEVGFSVDVYRAVYVAEKKTLLFDLAVYEAHKRGRVVISRVFGRRDWMLKQNGALIA